MVFNYQSGEEVQVGDRVGIDYLNDRGVVFEGSVAGVFTPDSPQANEYGCPDTGGILILGDDGEHQLWTEASQYLILLASDDSTDVMDDE